MRAHSGYGTQAIAFYGRLLLINFSRGALPPRFNLLLTDLSLGALSPRFNLRQNYFPGFLRSSVICPDSATRHGVACHSVDCAVPVQMCVSLGLRSVWRGRDMGCACECRCGTTAGVCARARAGARARARARVFEPVT